MLCELRSFCCCRLCRVAGSSRSILFSASISPSSTGSIEAEIDEHGQHVVALRLAVGMMRVADMDDDIGFGDLFERGAEGGDEMGRQVRDEADRVRQDRLAARRQAEAPHRRIEGREQHVLGSHRRRGSAG